MYPFDSVEGFLVNVLVKSQGAAVLQLEWAQLIMEAEYVSLGEAHGTREDKLLGVEDAWDCRGSLVHVGSHRLVDYVGNVLALLLGACYDAVVEVPVEPAYEDGIVSQVKQPARVILYILFTCLHCLPMLLINLVKSLKMDSTFTMVNAKVPQQMKGEEDRLMNDSTTRLLIEEFQELKESPLKKCEWCHQPLPNERYHLRICPRCRKATIDAFLKGEL